MFSQSVSDTFGQWRTQAAAFNVRQPRPIAPPEHQAALGKLVTASSDFSRKDQKTLADAFSRHGQTLTRFSINATQALRLISQTLGQADRGENYVKQAARRLDTTLERLDENDRTELAIELAQLRLNLPELLPSADTQAVQDALEELQVELMELESNQPPASSAPQQSAPAAYHAALSGAAFPKATKPMAPTFGNIIGPGNPQPPGPVNLTV